MNVKMKNGNAAKALLVTILLILSYSRAMAADYTVPSNGGTGSFVITMGAVAHPYNRWKLYQSFGSSSGPWTDLGPKAVGPVNITVFQPGLYYYKATQYNPTFTATGIPTPIVIEDTANPVYRGPASVSAPPPSAPQNVYSTDARNSYDGSYSLTWSVPSSGSASVTYYQWQQKDGNWNNVGLALSSPQISKPNGTYIYYVGACNSNGCNSSGAFSITVDRNIAPTISPSTTNTASGNYTIGWSSGRLNGTTPNQIWIYEDGIPFWVAGVTSNNSVQALPNPKGYVRSTQGMSNYYVQACYNSTFSGIAGVPQPGTGTCAVSNVISVTYDTPSPAGIGALTLGDSEGAYDTNGTIILSWSGVSYAAKYNVRYGKSGSTKTIRNSASATDTLSGLTEGVWEFDVQACNSFSECGSWSPLASKEVRFIPGRPTNLSSSDGSTTYDGQYSLTWSPPVVGQVNYYEWTDNGGQLWNGVGTALSVGPFVRSNNVTYQVRACRNGTGCGLAASATIFVNMDIAPTITPSATTTATGSYTIGWTNGKKNGQTLNQVWIYEDGVPYWVAGVTSNNDVQALPNPKPYARSVQGTSFYYVQACYNSTFVAPTNSPIGLPQAGTGVCSVSSLVSVTYDVPTPSAIGSLTLGDSEGTYDTNGTIVLSWTGVSYVSKYNVRYGKAGSTKTIRNSASATDTLSGLTEGVWEFDVQACNSFSECGSWSPLASKEVRFIPGRPTNLSSSDGSTTYDGQYSLTWSPPVVGQVNYYEWTDNGGQLWNGVGTALSVGPFVRSNNVTYQVRACRNGTGCGLAASATIFVNMDIAPTITPSATTTATGSYTIGWTNGKKNGQTLNQVWIYEDGVPYWVAGVTSNNDVQALPNPRAYSRSTQGTSSYYVQACYNSTFAAPTNSPIGLPQAGTGVCAVSNVISVKYHVPVPPSMPPFINLKQTAKTVDVSWGASSTATSYDVMRNTVTIASSVNATALNDAGVNVLVPMIYKVRACNSDGCSDWRASSSFTLPPVPPVPASVNASVGLSSITIVTSPSGYATKYSWRRNGIAISSPDEEANGNADLSVIDGNQYTYSVQACNETGCSEWVSASPIVAGVIKPGVPVNQNYDYDVLGRLNKVNQKGTVKTEYKYDNAGNRKEVIEN